MLIWECKECAWRGIDTEIISFADPEMPGNSWNICPNCRAAEQFDNMCDEPGCVRIAGCAKREATKQA